MCALEPLQPHPLSPLLPLLQCTALTPLPSVHQAPTGPQLMPCPFFFIYLSLPHHSDPNPVITFFQESCFLQTRSHPFSYCLSKPNGDLSFTALITASCAYLFDDELITSVTPPDGGSMKAGTASVCSSLYPPYLILGLAHKRHSMFLEGYQH